MLRRFVITVLGNALALWLMTALMSPHIELDRHWDGGVGTFFSYVVLAIVFGVVNGVLGTVIRTVGFLLYILTLGLVSFIVNAVLLFVVAWIAPLFGLGLRIEGFWWGVLGAFVLAVLSWLIGLVTRPLLPRRGQASGRR